MNDDPPDESTFLTFCMSGTQIWLRMEEKSYGLWSPFFDAHIVPSIVAFVAPLCDWQSDAAEGKRASLQKRVHCCNSRPVER